MLLSPEIEARLQDEAAQQTPNALAAYLQDALGQRMTAYLAGLNDVKQVGRYSRKVTPRPAVALRLREGYKIVRMIESVYDSETAKAWLFGTNVRLDDQAPIGILRQAEDPSEVTPVIRAARQFAAGAA